MSDALSFADIDGQHVELLPARTVLSLFSLGEGDGGTSNIVSNPNCQSAINQSPGLLDILPQNTADFTCEGPAVSSH